MAQIIGQLRNDATNGEKAVLQALKDNLPVDYTVYVETPIYRPRKVSNPDFIILTNYGYIILEVKDWSNFNKIDKHNATINSKNGPIKHFNPVNQARNYALDLYNVIEKLSTKKKYPNAPQIPYGFAVVFPFLAEYNKSKVRTVWGDDFVFTKEDLKSHVIKQSLRNTIRGDKIRSISKDLMDLVRGAINPEITFSDGVVLDEEQANIVLEPIVKQTPKTTKSRKKAQPANDMLFSKLDLPVFEEKLPEQGDKIINTNYLRLVRGVMGSGKTLVLLGKAKHWARTNPDWNILVLAFNRELAQSLKNDLKEYKNIHTTNIHKYIVETINRENRFLTKTKIETDRWVQNQKNNYKIIETLGVDFIAKELAWIQDIMVSSKEEYLEIKRIGRGNQPNITKAQRNEIYDLYLDHIQKMKDKRQISWEQLIIEFLSLIKKGEISVPSYDAILIDEAQDFAPSWISVVNELLKPDGHLFMVDDPTQSIFRYFTWKSKGIEVAGRSKRLRMPYRNTFEIYTAASSIVNDDPVLISQLMAEGEDLIKDEDLSLMRRGKKPTLVTLMTADQDLSFVETQIQYFRQKHQVDFKKMCVILPNTKELERFKKVLYKYGVKLILPNQVKGLTYDLVFLCGMENFFKHGDIDKLYVSSQKRLVFTCIGRAKEHLFLLHHKKLSKYLEPISDYIDYVKV